MVGQVKTDSGVEDVSIWWPERQCLEGTKLESGKTRKSGDYYSCVTALSAPELYPLFKVVTVIGKLLMT